MLEVLQAFFVNLDIKGIGLPDAIICSKDMWQHIEVEILQDRRHAGVLPVPLIYVYRDKEILLMPPKETVCVKN